MNPMHSQCIMKTLNAQHAAIIYQLAITVQLCSLQEASLKTFAAHLLSGIATSWHDRALGAAQSAHCRVCFFLFVCNQRPDGSIAAVFIHDSVGASRYEAV